MLICPVCGEELNDYDLCYRCRKNHSFDKSKEGYVNLLSGKHKNGSLIGDNRDMAHARREFLQKGYYDFLALAVSEMIAKHLNDDLYNKSVVDISCGEGYYTDYVKKYTSADVSGFDISKEMIRLAAKKYKDILFFVANIARIPIADESVDCAFQICAPFNEREFFRILKNDGIFISVIPGKRHLWELKELLYDTPYENDSDKNEYKFLKLRDSFSVRSGASINGNDDIHRLFSMTPYYYKTSPADKRKLEKVEKLQVTLEFDIRIFCR